MACAVVASSEHAQLLKSSTLSTASSSSSPDVASPAANGKVLCLEHAVMDVDISSSEANSQSNNHHHENGMTNGYSSSDKHKSSKSEHKDRHRDKDRDHKSRSKDHKSSRDKDKDRDRHHSSSKDKSSSHKSSGRDKDREKDKDRHRDKDRHKSSSSRDKTKEKDKEHRSSKDHKSRDKDKERSKEHRDKDKSRDKDKDRDRHRHSSSSKDKHRDKDRHREKDRDKDRKDRKSDKIKQESPEKVEIKEEPESQQNGSSSFYEDEKKLQIKEEPERDQFPSPMNNSQASSCDYNMSQFKDEPKFENFDDPEEEKEEEEDSEEDKPLAQRLASSKRKFIDSDEDEKPVQSKKVKKSKSKKRSHSDDELTDYEDFKPVKKEKKKAAKATSLPVKKEEAGSPKKRKKKAEEEQEVWKWWEEEKRDDGTKWKFLEHKGPVFAPPYERIPKNVKFYYDGKEISLSQDAEEVAGFYAKMLDHDYTTKEVFNNNFFKDWRKVMSDSERREITDLKKCNFKMMHAYFMDIAEKNRNRTKEEKLALKEKNEEVLKEYGFCKIDGHKEKIGNFKIEPPGLFRGRGEHPKMGMLKKRVWPEDVLINCSKDSAIPKPPPGHKWKEVRHDPGVTWLASWTENVQNQVKYVMLNPSSKLKGEKDWQKYETARRLHKCIDKIRSEYRDGWKSKEMRIRQRAVALYFIDKLALRAGNEKDEDQADTVGCCSLRVEHIQLHERRDGKDYVVVFDFLGKDSIRYYNEVPVEKRVYKNLVLFMENKAPGDDLFDRLNTAVMNKHLMELMDGLTAKVFRTYNASFTLQQQLDELTNDGDSLQEKILSYNRANRAVAILCNHQRAVPKSHEKSMEKLKEKIDAKREQIRDAERGVKDAAKDAKRGSVKEKQIHDKKKKALEKLREQLQKLEIQETDRDENKTIALGTSKLNYLDPRISVAWCKKHDVPIEKIYNKTQRDKFRWAIDMAGPEYVF